MTSNGDATGFLGMFLLSVASLRLVPKLPVDRALAEKYQLADIDWAVKQKGSLLHR